jgi:myosin heavy subunit
VVRALSELAHESGFVTTYVLEVNATVAGTEAQPIPLAQVEAEIFADADHHICEICGEVPPRREVDNERGLCFECAGHLDEGIKYYTEDFAFASIHGKDALRLLVLRQRADNCRDLIAAAAATYDGDLEAHEASVEEKMLNKRAAKCLARLPASFAPWWKDTWTHEKWCQMASARDKVGWAVEKEAPTERHEVCKLKAQHAEVLANIERARNEDMEAVEARHQREITELHKNLQDEMDAVDALRKGPQAMRADLERLTAENKELWQQIEEDKQMVQRHLKEIAKEHAQMTAWEKKEIERLTAENKELEHRVAEESHWCKHANLATRTAEMHAQMLRTDVAELKKENEGLRKLVFPSLNLQAASSGVKLEPEVAPRIAQVVQASPELVDALKAEKTWEAGTDICYALTKKDYKDMIKAKGALPSVEVVEPDARLELLQCPLPDQLMELMECGSYECPPVPTEPEPVPEVKAKRPNYNHPNWPSPTTKRFAKHLAKHSGQTDPKAIKTHEEALEFIAKRAKISVETLLNMSLKTYQSAHEPWSLVQDPWSPPNSLYFHCEL